MDGLAARAARRDDQLLLPLDQRRPAAGARAAGATATAEPAAMLLNVRQVATALGCGRTYVFELLASGELPMVKLGRLTRIPASALLDLIAKRTVAVDGDSR